MNKQDQEYFTCRPVPSIAREDAQIGNAKLVQAYTIWRNLRPRCLVEIEFHYADVCLPQSKERRVYLWGSGKMMRGY